MGCGTWFLLVIGWFMLSCMMAGCSAVAMPHGNPEAAFFLSPVVMWVLWIVVAAFVE